MSARLFLALWPGPATRAAIAAWQGTVDWPAGARLVRSENLHATLHFIGNVPVARLPEVTSGVNVKGVRGAMTFDRLESWKGGIAVLTPTAVPATLMALHVLLAERLTALDLPVEYPTWKPHVTLARHASGMRAPSPTLTWRSEGYALVSSAGGVYTVLKRYRG